MTQTLIRYRVTFGGYLKIKLKELDMSASRLARKTGMTRQNLSRIINDTPHWQTGALPRVTVETVDKIADGLGIDKDEVRLAAGFAPQKAFELPKPKSLPELIKALEDLGVPVPQLYGGFEGQLDENGEGFSEALERIYLDLELVLRRAMKKETPKPKDEAPNRLDPTSNSPHIPEHVSKRKRKTG